MKKAKKLLATFLALTMIFSTVSLFASSVDFAGENSVFNGYGANLGDGTESSFVYTSEFYKQVNGEWVPATTAQPGEEVRARVTLQTDFPTNQQGLIAIWDPDVFTDALDGTKLEATLSLNTDPNSYAVLHDLAANSFYTAYSNGAGYWDFLHEYYNTDSAHYIDDTVYNKYKNSWVYVLTANGMPLDYSVNPGTEWLFEIPLVVKDAADLTASQGSFMIVVDAWSSYDIDDGTDIDITPITGVQDGDGMDMGTWYDWDLDEGHRPHFDVIDATLTIQANVMVLFDKNAADAVLTGTDEYEEPAGTEITVPTVTRTGYHLNKWVSDNDAVDDLAADATTMLVPSSDVMFSAEWAPNIHTLTINYLEQGTDAVLATAYVNANAEYGEVYEQQSPAVTGYHLVDANQATVEVIMDDQDETVNVYYAPNPYSLTINYLKQGTDEILATAYYDDTVTYGSTYSEDSPAITGYHLADATQATISGTMGSESVEINVYYIPNEYTITYKIVTVDNEEEEYDTQTVLFGEQITTIVLPVNNGKTYSAWEYNFGEVPATMPAEDITLITREQWVNYTLSVYDPADDLVDNGTNTLHYGDEITEAQVDAFLDDIDFTEGYEFDKWVDSEGNEISFPITVTDNVDVYATEKAQSVPVTWIPDVDAYDENDPSTFDLEYIDFDESIPFHTAPSKTGYTFTGWYESREDETDATLADDWAAKNWVVDTPADQGGMIFMAAYEPNNYTLTVNYVMSDGNSELAPAQHTEEVAYNAPYEVELPAVTGYSVVPDDDINGGVLYGTMDAEGKTVEVTYAPNEYTLTVNYTMSDGHDELAPETYTEQVVFNTGYSVTPDDIPGYTPAPATVEGTMDAEGKTEEVVYTPNNYTLTIKYQYADESEAVPDYTNDYAYNSNYSVLSPVINGYTPSETPVEGTMDTVGGKTVVVTYAADPYQLTIHYIYEDGSEAAPDAVRMIDFNSNYSVESPAITGYTASEAVVEGVMDTTTGKELYVTYTINSYPLNITYVMSDGNDAVKPADVVNEMYEYNTSYSVASPAVFGYTPDVETVAGTMDENGYTTTVTYSPNEHTVTWIVDGDETTATYAFGEAIAEPAAPSKTGYDFAGWVPEVAATMGDEDLTYTAIFEAQSYDLVYYVENLSTGVTTPITRHIAYGTAIPGAQNPSEVYTAPAGFTFHGWFTDSGYNDGLAADATMPAEAYAVYGYISVKGYSVIFDLDGGNINGNTENVETEVAYMDAITAPADPVKEGYTFMGWSPALDANAVLDEPATRTYTATWEANEYTITYYASVDDHEAETVYEQNTYVAGAQVDPVADPVKEGNTFSEWIYYSADDDSTITFDGTMPAHDVYAIAVYNVYHLDITYVMSDGSDAPAAYSATVEYNDDYSVASPEVEGYTADIATVEGTMPAEDVAVTVTYTPNEYALDITYVMADGSEAPEAYSAQVTYNTAYSVASPELEGYTADIATVEGTMDDVNGKAVTVTYTPNTYTLTINYVDENGDPVTTAYEEEVAYNTTYSVTSPEVTNYHLANDDDEVISGTVPADDIVINVVYIADEYTLTINYVDADNHPVADAYSEFYTVGAHYSVPSPTVTGYTIADQAQATIAGDMPAEDLTINVIYNINNAGLTINYLLEGTSTALAPAYMDDLDYEENYSIASPSITGYHLVDAAQETIAGTMGVDPIEINVYYAPNAHTVTWIIDGEEYQVDNVVFGGTIVEPTVADREGYTLSDWTPEVATTVADEDYTYNATWVANEYTLTINYVDGDGNEVATAYTAQVAFGTDYSQASPDVENMHLVDDAQATVAGTMGAADVTVSVVYALDEYTFTINYVDGDGNEVAAAYTATLAVGADYSQASPDVENMHLVDDAQATVAGTMGAADVTVNVVYALDEYTLTINYVDGDGNEVATAYTATLAVGADYSQASPD
ncbi:MAG: MucBP domain-containing protein, partial [Clostridia bacterium]|nr:MucBP domain-containing protein [Clostridia bacterium]